VLAPSWDVLSRDSNGRSSIWLLGFIFLIVTERVIGQSDKVLEEIGIIGSVLDERSPFDIITLNSEAGGRSVRVNLIDFPERKLPASPKETDKFRVTFPVLPGQTFEIAWRDIAAVVLYEQLILKQANMLLEKKRFSEAFEHLSFLQKNYPQTSGLSKLRRDFLYRSAIDMAGQKRLPKRQGHRENPGCYLQRLQSINRILLYVE
jgi:hypothetical protein